MLGATSNLDPLDNVVSTDTVDTQFEQIFTVINNFKQQLNTLNTGVKTLERVVRKEMKSLKKDVDKNKNKGNRKPSGFAKPTKVSNELCLFMGKPEGSEIARTEVTQYLINYIKTNSLQLHSNKKMIVPDESLKNLLGVSEKDEVSYFNLQKFMNRHFIGIQSPNKSENKEVAKS